MSPDPGLSASDRELLARPLFGLLTVAPGRERLPAPRPVWFEVTDDGAVQLFSFAGAHKVRALDREPRATFVVVTPVGEPEAWVSIEADASVHDDGALDLARRLAERYHDMGRPENRALVDGWADVELRRIVLRPRRVTRGPAD